VSCFSVAGKMDDDLSGLLGFLVFYFVVFVVLTVNIIIIITNFELSLY
jgi:hypothetical protein